MRIQFCGADRTVTGSCHLIEVNGLRIFLDMGMYQGPREQARRINQYLADDATTVDAIILSHGHLDHCGKLPLVVRAGYKGPIYCTPATAAVARIVLLDAGKIQEEDAAYLNHRARNSTEDPVEPLYRVTDASAVLKQWKLINYGQKKDLGNGVSFTFFDAGHILGSAYVLLEYAEDNATKTLLFTADIGRYNTPIIRDPQELSRRVDHVITESTYGDKEHAPMSEVGPQLFDAVQYCVQHQSRLLVPSFAVGRTQTILWYMQRFIQDKKIPAIPIFVDSPMGVEVSRVHTEYRDNYDEETLKAIGDQDLFGMSRVTFAVSMEESKAVNAQRGACVIIASSPTCEFGRILHHLKQSIERANDVVVFVGWTPPGTLGRRLQDGQKRVKIYERFYDLKCQVRTIHGLSAHADGTELLRFLKPTIGKDTSAYVVHGEPDQAEGFARRLMQAGMGSAEIPAMESAVITSAAGLIKRPTSNAGSIRTDGD